MRPVIKTATIPTNIANNIETDGDIDIKLQSESPHTLNTNNTINPSPNDCQSCTQSINETFPYLKYHQQTKETTTI